MEVVAELASVRGSTWQIELDEKEQVSLEKARKYAGGKRIKVLVQIDDGRGATVEQKKKTHALANDFGEYTGWYQQSMDVMKTLYAAETGIEPFSFKDCSMSDGAKFIDWQIEYMLKNGVPFKTKLWDEISDDYRWQKIALEKRLCVVCGAEHADVAHYKAVGAGMNRNHVDPTKYMYMSLCRKHHTEQHSIGIMTFCQRHIIKPIKLDRDEIKKFNIGGKVKND